LQYHEVKINLEFRNSADLWVTNNGLVPTSGLPSLSAASLYIDYIYLDTDERRRFAQVSHEYLIEQLQYTGEESITNSSVKVRLNFNHPCKEFIWVFQRDDVVDNATANEAGDNQWTNYTSQPLASTGYDMLLWAKLQLNGHDRFSGRQARYFNLVQPYQHHSNIPGTGVYVYSFGLTPEQHQPSGTANMSRIDNATFQFGMDTSVIDPATNPLKLRLYAVNYNVLRIMSGNPVACKSVLVK